MFVVALMSIGVLAISVSGPLAAAMTMPALVVAFWRNAIGTAVVAPALKPSELGQWRWMAAAGVALAVHFGTWIPSLRLTSVASATALVGLQVAWIVLWELLRGTRYPAGALAGMVIAFCGTLVVTGVDLSVSSRALAGDALALLGGMGSAAYMVIGARVRRTTGTSTYTAVAYGSCAATLLIVCLASGLDLFGHAPRQWGLLLALVISAQLLGHSVFNHLLHRIGASTVALAMLLEVPGAAIIAAIFLGQTPPPAVYVGLCVVLVGMAQVIRVTNPTTDAMSDAGGR